MYNLFDNHIHIILKNELSANYNIETLTNTNSSMIKPEEIF